MKAKDRLTQYIKAQYQTSTRNGNRNKSRLKRRFLNGLVSNVETLRRMPKKPTSRCRLVVFRTGKRAGERGSASKPSPLERLSGLDSRDDGEVSSLSSKSFSDHSSGSQSFLRFTHVPPKRRPRTIAGSTTPPIPIFVVLWQIRTVWGTNFPRAVEVQEIGRSSRYYRISKDKRKCNRDAFRTQPP